MVGGLEVLGARDLASNKTHAERNEICFVVKFSGQRFLRAFFYVMMVDAGMHGDAVA